MVDTSVRCLFCNSEGPLSVEHIIPESLGNDDLLLKDQVCAACNNHFSRKVEAKVLQKSPLGFWRVFLGIRTKRRKLPNVDLSQPKKQKGRIPCVHSIHDNRVAFASHEDGSTSVDIDDSRIIQEILNDDKTSFRFVFTPRVLTDLGRFLCKVGVELVCLDAPRRARSADFDKARRFARFGDFEGLWPIFHFTEGTIRELKRTVATPDGLAEDVDCYSFSLLEVGTRYVLLRFGIGTDHWIVCLNDPFPTPGIRLAFPHQKFDLIWYSPDELS